MKLIKKWLKNRKKDKKETTGNDGSKKFWTAALTLITFIILFYTLLTSLQPVRYNLRIGQLAPEDIHSPKLIVDEYQTRELREEAVNRIESVYRLDAGIYSEVKKDIDLFFETLYDVKSDEEGSEGAMTEEDMALAMEDNVLGIHRLQLAVLLDQPVERLENLQNYLHEIAAQRMNNGIKVADLQQEKSQIREYMRTLTEFDEDLRETAATIINASLRPNEFLDIEATEDARLEAEESVETLVIRRGDTLIRQGERITADRLAIMRELGLLEEAYQLNFTLYAGITLTILLAMALVIGYLNEFQTSLLKQLDKLLLLSMIIVIIVAIARPLSLISPYLVPVAVGAMLLSMLMDARLAIMANIIITLLVGMITGNNMVVLLMGLTGGTAGVLSMVNLQQRGNIFVSGVIVGAANMIIISLFGLLGMHDSINLWIDLLYAFLNGVLCAVLTIGSLPFWEYAFSILTPLKLIELSNPAHPLLKRLLMEAPGTYHHSVVVGNLAESAVNAVGGDGLLVRTGAFYHDIGKLKRPFFFKENQYMMENPHDKLAPSLSALIITGHVKDGIEIAEKNRLPKQITAFVEEHHGTTLAAYFYHKAKTGSLEPDKVDEQRYRYNGPIPQSRETAILMLADSVEAAVRSMENPTRDKIEQMIQKIIQFKLDDGQLEECPLTLKELKEIRTVFTQILSGIMHERIKYPEMDIKELKGKL